MKTSTDATHSVEVWYSDGKTAKTQLIVKSQDNQADNNDDNEDNGNSDSTETVATEDTTVELQSARSPKTGEGSDAGWMTLLAVSIVCLMGCGIYGTKEKNTEQH